ncbi:hypothetical protein AB0G67_40165 [Streptomyces sp. NPDC021056]|uniref:hypothetical protein n=1 Tax=Streptomyces sp. NPDC021056 TaxID=3155012 RepID=UPI0033C60046
MTVMTVHTSQTGDDAEASYASGFLDGELDAASKLPATLHQVRASWGDLHDPTWAAGYTDGYSAETGWNAIRREQVA